MRRLASLAAALALASVLAACTAADEASLAEGGGGEDQKAAPARDLSRVAAALDTQARCEAEGGVWGMGGLNPEPFCNLRYEDAGEACRSADECGGRCIARDERGTARAGRAVGQCQTYTSQFGCYALVEDGYLGPTLCVD